MQAREAVHPWKQLADDLANLERFLSNGDVNKSTQMLRYLVPEYNRDGSLQISSAS